MRLSPLLLGSLVVTGCALNRPPEPAIPDGNSDRVVYVRGTPAPDTAPSVNRPATSKTSPADAPAADLPATSTSAPTVIPAGTPVAFDSAAVSHSDVARRAIEVFGDSLVLQPPPVLDSSTAGGPSWDMDVRPYETQARVAHYVSRFSGPSREHIAARLEVGTRYEPMIRAKMRAGGLPEDMYYLALIESGFDNNAYSRAAAVGMWQFMTSTARGMGLRVDWWVDERRDPVKSTAAAVRFIRGMRDQFGSLYLAAAAYNGGPGRVARGLARYADDLENTQGEDAFFVLAEKDYLRNETREYVPQLIAAALIAKDPKRYGMTIRPRPAFAYDSVKVPAATPLAAIAAASDASVADIRELNPQLLRGMTPPRVPFVVRIPPGTAQHFDSSFAALPKADRTATKVVESKKGDTVDRLAEKHGISAASLTSFNPHLRKLKPSGKLVPGQAILIPTRAVARAALNVPDPSIERYPGSRSMRMHTVKRGESVGLIARKYHTTPERIMRLNGLKKAMIFPGQTLVVSGERQAVKSRRRKH